MEPRWRPGEILRRGKISGAWKSSFLTPSFPRCQRPGTGTEWFGQGPRHHAVSDAPEDQGKHPGKPEAQRQVWRGTVATWPISGRCGSWNNPAPIATMKILGSAVGCACAKADLILAQGRPGAADHLRFRQARAPRAHRRPRNWPGISKKLQRHRSSSWVLFPHLSRTPASSSVRWGPRPTRELAPDDTRNQEAKGQRLRLIEETRSRRSGQRSPCWRNHSIATGRPITKKTCHRLARRSAWRRWRSSGAARHRDSQRLEPRSAKPNQPIRRQGTHDQHDRF